MTDAHPPIPREVALPVAEAIRDNLLRQKVAVRAEVAGSLRRLKETVHDAEVVIELPTQKVVDLEGNMKWVVPAGAQGRLDRALLENEWSQGTRGLILQKAVPPFARPAWGEKYRKLDVELPNCSHVQVDLFICTPPANYWNLLLIRTGAALFSEKFVTRLHRWGLRSEGGRILRADDSEVPIKSEGDLFATNHLEWIEPERRNAQDPLILELLEGL
ncbi:MAG: hypothetical protein KGI98_17000 [Euryarchaeota archaeon]|nr:hypothetical protein [Euryarchaeota archaeon]MDE1881839.1 hypothetical protein [Euryarchaeota archaeon]